MIAPDARLLGFLFAIAEHGSFNRASVALGISQPALSVKIAQLERQIGVSVFVRSPRGAVLTAYGELLLHHARTIETVRQRAADELRLRKLGTSGTLIVGATAIALVKLIPEALGKLDCEVGHLAVQIIEGLDGELNDRLRRREIDIMVGVVGYERSQSGICETTLLEDRLDLVSSPQAGLDQHSRITLRDLQNRDWILPEKGTYFQRQIESLFIVAGLSLPESAVLCGSLLAMRRVAIFSRRLAILPRLAVQQDVRDGLLTAMPLAGPGTTRNIGYRLRNSEAPLPICLRFIDLMRDVAKHIESPLASND